MLSLPQKHISNKFSKKKEEKKEEEKRKGIREDPIIPEKELCGAGVVVPGLSAPLPTTHRGASSEGACYITYCSHTAPMMGSTLTYWAFLAAPHSARRAPQDLRYQHKWGMTNWVQGGEASSLLHQQENISLSPPAPRSNPCQRPAPFTKDLRGGGRDLISLNEVFLLLI